MSAITPVCSRPCRTTAPRPWAPKVCAGTCTLSVSHPATTKLLLPWAHLQAPLAVPRATTVMPRLALQQEELDGIWIAAGTAQAELLGHVMACVTGLQ